MDAPQSCAKSKNKQLEFPDKIKSIPIVFSTCFWLSENYNKIKAKNFVTKQTCNLAESTIKTSIDLASPFLGRFKDRVDQLDSIACNQLEKIENAFPIVKTEPNQILNQGKGLIASWTIQPAVQKIQNIKKFSDKKNCNIVTRICHTTNKYVDLVDFRLIMSKFLDMTENLVKENLTDEYKKQNFHSLNDFGSISERSRILCSILYNSLSDKLAQSLRRCLEVLRNFLLNIFKFSEFVQQMKKNAHNRLQNRLFVTKDKLELYKQYFDLLKRQLMVQDGRSLEHINTLEERTKIILRRNVGNLITILRIIKTKVNRFRPFLSENWIIATLCQIVSDIFHLINKPDGSVSDYIKSLIVEFTQTINRIENIKKTLSGLNSSILQWIVPNFDAFGVLDDFEDDESVEWKDAASDPKIKNSADMLLIDRFQRYRTLFYLENEFFDFHFRPIQMNEASYTPSSKTTSPSNCSSCFSPYNSSL